MPVKEDPLGERSRHIAFALWVTLALNWSVSLAKIVFGFLTQCMVIVADGVHSFSDGASNVIGLIAIRIASHPADKDHPYGHEKYETLAATAIAFFLFIVSFEIVRKALDSFFHPMMPQVSALSFVLMGATFLVNLFIVWYERKKARELNSEFLLSDSWHTLTDIFVTLTVILALVGIRFRIPYLDSIFSLGIAGVILAVAFGILKRSSDILSDKAVLDTREIETVVRRIPGVLDCHEIRTRGKTHKIYLDLHVLVAPEMSVRVSHHLANQVEYEIRQNIHGVQDVVVHIEPITHEHEELKKT